MSRKNIKNVDANAKNDVMIFDARDRGMVIFSLLHTTIIWVLSGSYTLQVLLEYVKILYEWEHWNVYLWYCPYTLCDQ